MESYLNTINLGQNCLGVQSASQRYFGKDVSDLTLSECAVIAGITQNPTDYDPVTRPENNKIRRNKVLKNMLEQGYISQKQYDKAIAIAKKMIIRYRMLTLEQRKQMRLDQDSSMNFRQAQNWMTLAGL